MNAIEPDFAIGPQYSNDDTFTARMRLHQSRYRAEVLRLPCGNRQGRNGSRPLGSMLRRADGEAGGNFLTSQVYEVVRRRVAQGGGVEVSRVLCNLLSSQPMCFNLFAPLVDDLDLSTRLAQALWSGIKRVTRVEIEWAPQPARAFLDDLTSFDAFIEYERIGGGLGFCGIETKLAEPFSRNHYDKPTYRRWMTPDSPWHATAAKHVDDVVHNQLWRNHLLVWSMLKHPASKYAEGRCVVVRHPEDHRCDRVLAGYRGLLRDTKTFQDLPIDQVVGAWRAELGSSAWLDDFERRYILLEQSERPAPKTPSVTRRRRTSDGSALREGHMRAVSLFSDVDAYHETRARYRSVVGPRSVYLRPTNDRLTVINLDYEADGAMVGVGANGSEYLTQLPPSLRQIQSALADYREKLSRGSRQRYSAEERNALSLISRALDGGQSLPGFPGVFFVHQEWRFPNGQKLDILGIEPSASRLLVLELKSSETDAKKFDAKKGGDAWGQAKHYADLLFQHRAQLYPFFADLAKAMALLHGGPALVRDVELDIELRPRIAVGWPDAEAMMESDWSTPFGG